MTTPAPTPTCPREPSPQGGPAGDIPAGKKRRGMVGFYVGAGVVIALLLIAVANWRAIHLAYCKCLMRSTRAKTRWRGLQLVIEMHLVEGMSPDQIRPMVAPLCLDMRPSPEEELQEASKTAERLRSQGVSEEGIRRRIRWDDIKWRIERLITEGEVEPDSERGPFFVLRFRNGRYTPPAEECVKL